MVQPRKTRPDITEKLLTGMLRIKSNKIKNIIMNPVQFAYVLKLYSLRHCDSKIKYHTYLKAIYVFGLLSVHS